MYLYNTKYFYIKLEVLLMFERDHKINTKPTTRTTRLLTTNSQLVRFCYTSAIPKVANI